VRFPLARRGLGSDPDGAGPKAMIDNHARPVPCLVTVRRSSDLARKVAHDKPAVSGRRNGRGETAQGLGVTICSGLARPHYLADMKPAQVAASPAWWARSTCPP
jgi:hypothetical protein